MNDTRRDLLEATWTCIAEHGYVGTTSRAITAAAGANLAAITYHFGSKDELVAEALVTGIREWLQPALDVFGDGGDPTAQTLAGIQELLRSFAEHRETVPAYFEALVLAQNTPKLRAGILELWGELRDALAAAVGAQQAIGALPDWADPAIMATLFIALANGLALQVEIDPDGPTLEALAAQFALLLIAAVPCRQP